MLSAKTHNTSKEEEDSGGEIDVAAASAHEHVKKNWKAFEEWYEKRRYPEGTAIKKVARDLIKKYQINEKKYFKDYGHKDQKPKSYDAWVNQLP